MSRVSGVRRFFRIERDGSRVERDVDDELRFHFDMTVRELMANGMSADDARREAERRFGDVGETRDRLAAIDRAVVVRERRADRWNAFVQDLRYALRGVRLKPGFAIAVMLTLGLGIGANATMFGIVDRLLFRPPAYLAAPDRVHRLYFARMNGAKEFFGAETQYQRYLDVTAAAHTLDVTAAYAPRRMVVGIGDDARTLPVGGITATMWRLFEARPALGRFFSEREDLPPNGTKVVVLSYTYWQSHYGGARSVLDSTMQIGPSRYTIIGVAPEHFSATALETPVAFIPLTAAGDDAYQNFWTQCRRDYCLTWIEMYARLAPNVTLAAASADLDRAFRESYRAQQVKNPRLTPIDIAKPHVVVASPLAQRGPTQSADTRIAKWLLGVAAVVLLIACANVGNLLLGRALRRRREIAVRLALGVSRGRLISQLTLETLVLAVLGGIAGLAIAEWGGRVLRALLLPRVEWTSTIADPRVALFSSMIALACGLLCGLVPILHAGKTELTASLKAGAREGSLHRSRMRSALLVLQAALSVILLAGAGLFVRSLRNVNHVHLGYDAKHLLWMEPRLRGVKLDSAGRAGLRRQLLDAAQQDPTVAGASLGVSVPFYIEWDTPLFVAGIDSTERLGIFHEQKVSPGYFATSGTRLLRGRGIMPEDRVGAPLAIVVSEAMARALWPGQDAIGKCVRVSADTMPCSTVVGVAENVKQESFGDDPSLTYYQAFDQTESDLGGLFVRTRGTADANVDAVRRTLQRAMPAGGYVDVKPMSQILAPEMRSWELGATMFLVFGGLALLLAAIGLYGVIAFAVAERTHEMGVRIALGAHVADVVGLIVRDALRVVAAGLAIGVAVALAAGRWVSPLLFQVSSRDPAVFGVVALVLLCVAVAASWLPAMRASRVDPSVTLRAD